MFSRGDTKYVELVMEKFLEFSKATRLVVNPQKCKAYYGGVNDKPKNNIQHITSYVEGKLPFRYLGIPLTAKKLSTNHYLKLVEKLVNRIKHWSNALPSHACHTQLIRSVLFATTNYWLQCIPLSEMVIKKVEAVCQSFLKTSKVDVSCKSHVAWKNGCEPNTFGGLNVISLT